MKRKICFSILLVFIIGISASAQDSDYKSDRIFVRFSQVNGQAMTYGQKATVLANNLSGSRMIKSYSLVPGLSLVQLPDGIDVPIAIGRLNQSKLIEYAEPVYRRYLDIIPNDTYFPLQWSLYNRGQFGGKPDADIDANDAWDVRNHRGVQSFIVAVLDTGVDYNHPDLKANMWVNHGETPGNGIDDDGNGYVDDVNGWDTSGPDNDPCDVYGHGTHVAGIIGARGNNATGITGVNWYVSLMAVKIFSDNGGGSDDLAIAGIQYVLANKARGVDVKVINASWGGTGYSQALYDAIDALRQQGILFVAAAGNSTNDNDGLNPAYPASYDLDNIISVMATDQDDNPSSFSNFGLRSVDLGAPGSNIYSTTPTRGGIITGPNYAYMSGTSMAAPHVAGACAFVWSFDLINLDYTIVRDAVLYTTDPLPSLSGLCVTGGRLNLKEAVEAVNTKVINTRFPSLVFPRIQQAIDYSATRDGDTLIAHYNHRYYEAVDFKGKKITLRSGDIYHISDPNLHPENTYIVARGRNRHAVTFDSGEDATTAIKGFTIMNGYAAGSTMFDKFGGGIYCSHTSPEVNDCNIFNNSAQYDGGGIYCDDDSNPTIVNCTFNGNSAAGRDGGAIYCYDSSPTIKNCLIINNKAARDGGGIYFNGYSPTIGQPKVINCTIVGNSANSYDGLGGALYCYYHSKPVVKDCIFSKNPNYAIFEEDTDSDPALTYSLFYDNPDGDYYDADTLHVYTGASAINAIPDGYAHNNITSDPAFARGRLGNYYLSQISAGQLINSIAVNSGSTTAVAAGLNKYTTRTDNTTDSGQVDIGFHYFDTQPSVNYQLTTSVVPTGRGTINPPAGTPVSYKQYSQVALTATASDSTYQFYAWHGTDDDTKIEINPANGVPLPTQNNIVTMDSNKQVTAEFESRYVSLVVTVTSANGRVDWSPPPDDPRRDLYLRSRVVTLTAVPDNPSYRVKWTGTNDDTTSLLVNTVTMTDDKQVFVEFYAPKLLDVGGGGEPGAYTNLGEAIEDARNGDVIQIHEGEWWAAGFFPFFIDGKAITIRSTNPDDPCVVARTVLHNYVQFENVGRDTVLAGVTISNITYICISTASDGGSDPNATAPPLFSDCDGYDGGSIYGGGIDIGEFSQSSPLYPQYPGLFGEASPTIINCVVRNINMPACDGGNGVGGTACSAPGDGGWGGRAYGGGVYIGPDCKPLFKNVTIRECNAIGGDGGNPGTFQGATGVPGSWEDPTSSHWWFGPYDEVWKYSGHGGGAYCDVNSAPEFIDCNFINNTAQGGSSGTRVGFFHSRIDSYGAAVYCAAESSPKFTNCRFVDNIIDANGNTPLWRWSPKLTPGENVAVRVWDKYFGYGGAVAGVGYTRSYQGITIELEGGQPVFENCTFINNQAPNGTAGAMHWMRAFEVINKSTFSDNSALHGGALYLVNGENQILESTFTGNTASDVVGEGGAIFAFDANTIVADSNITGNTAVTSGGGVFISGPNTIFKNDLIKENTAGRDGGGISANLYADVNIANCTISGNVGGKFGGGLYCSYNSFTSIIDSIIWGNFAVNGPQIAIGSYDPHDPQPSVVEVSYSDIGPRYSLTAFDIGQLAQSASSQFTQVIGSQTIETELANNGGWARIVISLDEPTALRKATNWDSPASVAALQAEINLRQQAVLSTLTSEEFTLRYRCKNTTTFSGLITASGLNKLTDNPQVRFIEPVRIVYPAMRQGLNLTNGMGIRPTYSGSGVAVAIVDTGVDYRHSKLGGGNFPNSKVIGGYDTGMMDADPMPVGVAHGTCCAGIAAGDLANVGDYIGGVAYNAKIYALKAAPDNAGFFFWDAILTSWDWCITHKNDNPAYPILVISNSFGGELFSSKAEADAAYPAEAAMVSTVVDAGITVLASSGNEYATNAIAVPSALSNVISVGAVYDTSDRVTEYSNTAAILDMFAPSDPTYTTDIIGAGGYAAGDYDPYFNGTSAACPFAAGTGAVIQSAAKQIFGHYLTPGQVRAILTSSGDLVTDTKVAITKPRVNIGATIDSLLGSPIYIEQLSRIEHNWWDAATNTWNPASHNLAVNEDPLFVEGFFLSQIAAGEPVDSNCVDAGHTDASTAGMYRHTTRTDLVIDILNSPVDLGYHYVRTTEFRSDLNYDGIVDTQDLLYLWRHWLETGCEFPDWCQGADLTEDGIVNFYDLAILAKDVNAGLKETTPPEPNPMTWDIMPTSAPSATWATMTATKAKDAYGGPIEYYFQRTNASGVPDGFYRNWDPNRRFYNTGLTLNQTYGYRVKARDFKGNETGWSVIGYATVGKESPPSAPINLAATAVSASQINLTWTDTSGNETGFKIQRRTDVNPFAQIATVGANVNMYNNTGLTAGTTYTYRVIAYNTGGDSPPSNEASATTLGGGGVTGEPNQPVMISGNVDPNSTQTHEADPNTGIEYWFHTIVATVPDIGGGQPVWFRFVCTGYSGFNSPWISDAATFPMFLLHPVSANYPNVQVTVNGTTVTYRIAVKESGAFGWPLDWKVCASYNATGTNSSCSNVLRIPWH